MVIIGSGATAVTLLPAMAKTAGHVTMLQRSPTYIVSLPEQDAIANWLRRVLPATWAYRLSRWKNIALHDVRLSTGAALPEFREDRHRQKGARGIGPRLRRGDAFHPALQSMGAAAVPGAGWRICSRRSGTGRASVVTDEIDRFTESGIQLKSGKELEADIVVTATGLVLQAFGGAELSVDGHRVDPGETLAYKGVMMSGVPNFASVFGYINASWTLKADLICAYVCRLLNLMDRKGVRQVMPKSGEKRRQRRSSKTSSRDISSARSRAGPSRARRRRGVFIRTTSAT